MIGMKMGRASCLSPIAAKKVGDSGVLVVRRRRRRNMNEQVQNSYNFCHFGLIHFVMYVNGKQIPFEGLTIDTGHEKTTVLGYRTLFEGPDIYHSNTGLQITHDRFITGYFVLLFDLTPDQSASDRHTSLSEKGNIRIELKFNTALATAITYLLYLEHYRNIQIDKL
jgi:glycogen debranching enzyme